MVKASRVPQDEVSLSSQSIHISLHLFVWVFSGIVSLDFCKFWLGARNSSEVVNDSWIFWKKENICFWKKVIIRFSNKLKKPTFAPYLNICGKWSKNGPRVSVFEFLKKLIMNFFWIWSIIKVCVICYILAQLPFFRKVWLHYLEKSRGRQNAVGQLYSMIF